MEAGLGKERGMGGRDSGVNSGEREVGQGESVVDLAAARSAGDRDQVLRVLRDCVLCLVELQDRLYVQRRQ